MKKNRFGQLIMLLVLLALIACGGFWFSSRLDKKPEIAGRTSAVTGEAGIAGGQAQEARFTLPALQPGFANMTFTQKKQVIKQAQKDAEAAARAGGQTEAQAVEAGQAAAQAAQRAFDRPSGIGGNP